MSRHITQWGPHQMSHPHDGDVSTLEMETSLEQCPQGTRHEVWSHREIKVYVPSHPGGRAVWIFASHSQQSSRSLVPLGVGVLGQSQVENGQHLETNIEIGMVHFPLSDQVPRWNTGSVSSMYVQTVLSRQQQTTTGGLEPFCSGFILNGIRKLPFNGYDPLF